VRPRGSDKLGTKAELKNMNSFKNVEAAIEYEIGRQIEVVKRGERVVQESRLWNVEKNISIAMRSKEQAHDYRYFPEPDLPPLRVDEAWEARVKGELPELPLAKRNRYVSLALTEYDATTLTADNAIADYFEAMLRALPHPEADAVLLGGRHIWPVDKLAANWLSSELLGRLNKADLEITASPVAAPELAALVDLIEQEVISGKIAKDVLDKMWSTGKGAKQIVDEEGLVQVTDTTAIEAACKAAVDGNPKQAEAYRGGKAQLLGYFVGQVMKATQGKANPELVNATLKKLLG
jgi:aspartyl-tRNA(Asn)/glutamyl-tRNA(Gln) amidotransferase subunit B